ncbi:class I SAM-dependent methyltransferase [Streptomyces sp. NPDC088725]|uniref:class I SAM-dependent methyltransferase n=1 Tax=Streptomyces sp. NPDC088725 TaxID=3365873 RepID=UPI00380B6FFD
MPGDRLPENVLRKPGCRSRCRTWRREGELVSIKTASPALSSEDWDALIRDRRVRFHTITDRELLQFRRHFFDPRGRVAVDAGCGTGAFARQLHAYGYDVTGLDFSAAALTAARITGLRGLRYVAHDITAGTLPALPRQGIDLVVCRHTIGYLAEPAAWASRVRTDWLTPGGQMYVVTQKAGGEGRLGALTQEEISEVARGWAQVVQYDMGHSAYLMLRSPTPPS